MSGLILCSNKSDRIEQTAIFTVWSNSRFLHLGFRGGKQVFPRSFIFGRVHIPPSKDDLDPIAI